MEPPTPKQYFLPFSDPKKRAQNVESAAVYAVAESNRSRGGGLFSRQPQETLVFIAKLGYPLWLIPIDGHVLTFDGLDDSTYDVTYFEAPSASTFMHNLQENLQPKEKYTQFLAGYIDYFDMPSVQQNYTLKGLLASIDFRVDFTSYLKEATQKTDNPPTIKPTLELAAVTAAVRELTQLKTYLEQDTETLQQVVEATNKTTSQYLQELDFIVGASKDEFDAKIKAQEEFIKPQIIKFTKETKAKTKELTLKFNREISEQEKRRRKILKSLVKTEAEIRKYESEAKRQAQRGHEFYEHRWKDKVKFAQKDYSALKKELRDIEENIKKIAREKGQEISRLGFELDEKTRLIHQPLTTLKEDYEAKMLAFKQQSSRLLTLQKNLVESISRSVKQREKATADFNSLGVGDFAFEGPSQVHVPFYLVCYRSDSERRYLCFAPATVENVDLSAKFKGAFGRTKIRDLLTPRFTSLVGLISKVEAYSHQNSEFEMHLFEEGTKNNLLKNPSAVAAIKDGLATLNERGWLSEKENSELTRRFIG